MMPTLHGRRLAFAALAAGLAALLLVSACTTSGRAPGDREPSATPGTSTDPSRPLGATPTATPTAPPAPERPDGPPGPSGGTPTATPTAPPTPRGEMDAPPTPTGLAPGEVGLYLAFSGRSNSEPFRLPNGERITLERSSRGIALFRPDSGEQTLIDTYSSPSYSRSAKRPYVLDGRLFIVRHWTDSKRQDYTELDPATHRVLSTTTGGGRSDDEVYAIVGDEVFFLTSPRFEPIGPSAKPRLKRMPLGPDSFGNDVVLNEDAGFFHGGTLLADAGNLYWATKQEDELGLYEVSQTTEDVTPIDLFRVLDAEDSMSWSFAAADGVFYWAVLRTDRHVELWRYDPSAGGSPAVLDEVLLPPEVSPFGARIDADDGHLAVWLLGQPDGDSQFILYDPETASSRIVDTGLRVFGFQVSRG